MNFLITGTRRGFGRFLHEKLGGVGLTRGKDSNLDGHQFDVIIHCANNRNKFPTSSQYYEYYLDNIKLTQDLVKLDHILFVYLSTTEVYPCRPEGDYKEEDEIALSDLKGVYPFTKLLSEKIVERETNSFLILRLSALLGQYTRRNTIRKLIEKENGPFSLTGDSVFNIIAYEDVLNFIRQAIKQNIVGTFNVVSEKSITLEEVAKMVNVTPRFGKYRYVTGEPCGSKLKEQTSLFDKTSKEVLKTYLHQI